MKKFDRSRALELVRKVLGPKPAGQNVMNWLLSEVEKEFAAIRNDATVDIEELKRLLDDEIMTWDYMCSDYDYKHLYNLTREFIDAKLG
jgi:hypothetical protein